MATSNTYEFGTNTQIDDLIRESFERIGISGNVITGLQLKSAIMSANLELTSWQGKVPLSWTRKRFMTSLYVGQAAYQLPSNITRIVDAVAIQPTRLNSGGTAFSSAGGTAANCFDATNTVGCTQTSPDGYISYNYGIGVTPSLQYVGITTLPSQSTYTLVTEYSFDGTNWFTIYSAPTQTYFANQITWFVLTNALNAQYWRIRETGGATLSLQQIYFCQSSTTGTGDRVLRSLSYTEWMETSSKNSMGFPNSYFFDMQINPVLTLYPILEPTSSNNQYTALLYDAYQYSQDVVALFQQFDVPRRFYDALVAGVSYRLAVKFSPDKVGLMKQDAVESFQNAALTEFQAVPLRFQPDFSYYGG